MAQQSIAQSQNGPQCDRPGGKIASIPNEPASSKSDILDRSP
jgi:hypothetical protein